VKPRLLPRLAVLALAVLALGACRAEERDRALKIEKGVYLGKKDTALKPEVEAALAQRVLFQRAPD
jgi:hypothetical protein